MSKKIAITVNDVLRVFSENIFPQYQKLLKNRLNEPKYEMVGEDEWVENKENEKYIPEKDFMGLIGTYSFLNFKDSDEYEKFLFEDFKFNLFSAAKMTASHLPASLTQYLLIENKLGNEVTIIINDNYIGKNNISTTPIVYDLTYQTLNWLGRNLINVKKIKVIRDNKELEDYDVVVSADPTYNHKNKIEINEKYSFIDYIVEQINKHYTK